MKHLNTSNKKRLLGFTLIEMLVVIGIIAILAAVVLVAVNPLRQFASARNSQRRSDLYAVTNAVYQYAVEHNGSLTALGIPNCSNPVVHATDGTDIGTVAGGLNLAATLVPTYIADIPFDPTDVGSDGNVTTNYRMCIVAAAGGTGRVMAIAADELTAGTYITVSR